MVRVGILHLLYLIRLAYLVKTVIHTHKKNPLKTHRKSNLKRNKCHGVSLPEIPTHSCIKTKPFPRPNRLKVIELPRMTPTILHREECGNS